MTDQGGHALGGVDPAWTPVQLVPSSPSGPAISAIGMLMDFSWPGNIRELRYCVERAIILADGDELDQKDFAFLAETTHADQLQAETAKRTLDELEKESIDKVLRRNHGNVSHTAKELGLTRTSLYRRIHKYGL